MARGGGAAVGAALGAGAGAEGEVARAAAEAAARALLGVEGWAAAAEWALQRASNGDAHSSLHFFPLAAPRPRLVRRRD